MLLTWFFKKKKNVAYFQEHVSSQEIIQSWIVAYSFESFPFNKEEQDKKKEHKDGPTFNKTMI